VPHKVRPAGATVVFLIIAAPILFLPRPRQHPGRLEFFMVRTGLNENIQAIRDRGDMS